MLVLGFLLECMITAYRARACLQLLRNVNENIQQVDIYPKGRQMLHDEEYLAVLKVGHRHLVEL